MNGLDSGMEEKARTRRKGGGVGVRVRKEKASTIRGRTEKSSEND